MKIFQSVNSPRSLSSGRASRGPVGHFLRDENGATAIEYAMIAAGIGVAVAATVMSLGSKLNTMYDSVQSAWPS